MRKPEARVRQLIKLLNKPKLLKKKVIMDWIMGIILFTFISVQLMKWLTRELYDVCKSKIKTIKDNLIK